MNEKKLVFGLVGLLLLGIIYWSLYVPDNPPASEQILQANFLNDEKVEVGTGIQPFSIVNDVQNVSYIYFEVTIKNTGDNTLDVWLTGLTPDTFVDHATSSDWSGVHSLSPDMSKTWRTIDIPTALIENTTESYEVTVNMQYSKFLKKSEIFTKTGKVTAFVSPDIVTTLAEGDYSAIDDEGVEYT